MSYEVLQLLIDLKDEDGVLFGWIEVTNGLKYSQVLVLVTCFT